MTVAVVEVESDRPDEDELAAAYREASESADRLAEEWNHFRISSNQSAKYR